MVITKELHAVEARAVGVAEPPAVFVKAGNQLHLGLAQLEVNNVCTPGQQWTIESRLAKDETTEHSNDK